MGKHSGGCIGTYWCVLDIGMMRNIHRLRETRTKWYTNYALKGERIFRD